MAIIALIGAGGKMGGRISDRLSGGSHQVYYVENGERGRANMSSRGLAPSSLDEAAASADVVVLAVPDTAIRVVAAQAVPLMKSGAMLMLLDPAAAYAGHLPEREDIAYFVAHPCHPPVFGDEDDPEARRDFFGGIKAKQAIVCALMQGEEADYARGEALGREIYAPVMRSHRMTVEQMATLEPGMAETIGASAAMFLRGAMDEAIRQGVPAEAARDFMLGHIHIELAIAFGEAGNPFSDACQVAMAYGREAWLKPGWERLLSPESVREQVDIMLAPRSDAV